MVSYENWLYHNRPLIEHLYYYLIDLSNSYGIQIIDNDNTINNFIKMMYNQSNKIIATKDYFPEFYAINQDLAHDF